MSKEEWRTMKIFYRLEAHVESTKKLFYSSWDYLAENCPVGTITGEHWPFLYMNTCLVNLVSALEYFVKHLFESGIGSQAGRDIFHKKFIDGKGRLTNTSGSDWLYIFFNFCLDVNLKNELTDEERKWLKLLLQGRNIIVHNGWLIDKDFMDVVDNCNNNGVLKVEDYWVGKEFLVDKIIFESSLIIINKIKKLAEQSPLLAIRNEIGLQES
ncbi:MAG: hypothetical protein HPY60_09195 [Candidatus Methanofastidiosum sp.]|nr:hypothetical protein [Methanofastidiosum sp.]